MRLTNIVGWQGFLNGIRVGSLFMKEIELASLLSGHVRRSYASLAAWMTRANRPLDPSRVPDHARTQQPSRSPEAPRRVTPARPG